MCHLHIAYIHMQKKKEIKGSLSKKLILEGSLMFDIGLGLPVSI